MKRESIINVFWSLAASVANIGITLFAQRIFLSILNTEYLGLNGLFSNVISMLGIFELGIGTAVVFSLYKPLSRNDKEAVRGLMRFYKKAYNIIALAVTVVGLGILPAIPVLIKQIDIDVNIYVIYLMFLADIVFSYLLSYRRSILYADRKNYQINIIHILYLVVMNAFQLLVLALTKNYYLYLSIKVIMRIAENLAIHLIVKKQYPYLNKVKDAQIDKTVEKSITKSVKALFLHKIGGFIVLGSDNIIISKFIGLVEVGLYSNYYIVINAAYTIIGQAISALAPSVGHMLAIKKSEETFDAFKKTRFANFILSCAISVGFFAAIQPFVRIWLGEEYLLSTLVVAVLAVNMFQRLQRFAYSSFKEAAGIFREDRFVPLLESAINIVASIILLQFFGLAGVFMGTAISDLTLWTISYPKFVYKKLFKRSYKQYFFETLGYFLVFVSASVLAGLASLLFNDLPIFVQLFASAGSAMLIFGAIVLVLFWKNDNFVYYRNIVLGIFRKK